MAEAYRQMQVRATPANLFLSSVRLHFVDDQRAWDYFQDVQFRFGRREMTVTDFLHRNTVLLQRDTDLLKQLFPFLAPYTCYVVSSANYVTTTVSHPQQATTQLTVRRSNEPASTAYYRTFQNS
ncbi:hypothetical protein AURDEDRAFT_112616 [Auricularia subglabra TFB-10046 SS5]|nr:hypothetical protein AURDEDRAFT_112616 [Auricularia subglabra TFB-10046 SS5]